MRLGTVTKICSAFSLVAVMAGGLGLSPLAKANHCCPPKRPMALSSPAFRDGERIPKMYTADGSNITPPLLFTNVPKHTKKLVLICDDPDASGGPFVHWVIFNLLGNSESVPEGLPDARDLSDGSRQGVNSFGRVGYDGPSPPAGKEHHYVFRLYALNGRLHLKAKSTAAQVLCTMKGHILAEAKLMGTYSRP
jgi:Raf kinase inhibitor-like YbhB/YbcL family protein